MKTTRFRTYAPIVAIVAILCGALSVGALTACSPATNAKAGAAVKTSIATVVDFASCSAAANGPLATYLSGNLDSADAFINGTKNGGIVTDILCALAAIGNAIPSDEIATAPPSTSSPIGSTQPAAPGSSPGYVPGAQPSTSPPRGAGGVTTGAVLGPVLRGASPSSPQINGVSYDAATRGKAISLLGKFCDETPGRVCGNLHLKCIPKQSARPLRPGESACP